MKDAISPTLFWSRFPFRPARQEQVDGINFLIAKMNQSSAFTLASEYAYILATIKHECAEHYQPIRELITFDNSIPVEQYYSMPKEKRVPWLRESNLPYLIPHPKTGQVYLGYGYVQLTHYDNYVKLSDAIGVDLVSDPKRAMEPENAWSILEVGMSRGLFTGMKLGRYINTGVTDFFSARKVINYLDQAFKIQSYAEAFLKALR